MTARVWAMAAARWRASRWKTPRAVPARLAGLRAQGLTLHLLSGDSTDAARIAAAARARTAVAGIASRWSAMTTTRRAGWRDIIHRGAAERWRSTAPTSCCCPDQALPQIDTARRTRRIIRQNLAWAVGYNLVALPLAAAGLVVPWMAALAMVLSSLTVTLNALRLARVTTA
jgi:Cu2+-exporting ATPase